MSKDKEYLPFGTSRVAKTATASGTIVSTIKNHMLADLGGPYETMAGDELIRNRTRAAAIQTHWSLCLKYSKKAG